MKKLILGVVALATLVFTSCSSDDDTPATSNLSLSFNGLEDLGNNYQYEGWIIVNGSPVSTGTFKVDGSGALSQSSFNVNTSQLAAASNFVLSIEPIPDTDPLPAATKILAGEFNGNTASINSDNIVVASNSSVGTLGASEGKYIIATPTSTSTADNDSGVWFLDNSTGSAMAGLNLPALSSGWKYEGWVVFAGGPVSTGTFLSGVGADENALTSPYKGSDGNGPEFPGEDFITGSAAGVTFPTSLKGNATLVISVEPFPDNDPKPFTLKPLLHAVDMNAANATSIDMGAGPVSILNGTVLR